MGGGGVAAGGLFPAGYVEESAGQAQEAAEVHLCGSGSKSRNLVLAEGLAKPEKGEAETEGW